MNRRNWKNVRPNSLVHAFRLCAEFGLERYNKSVGRIADHSGTTHDSMYKYIATGRMPAILIPAFEQACGCHFVSTWLATNAGKLVIDMPKGRTSKPADMVEFNTGFAAALQLLSDFYASPGQTDTAATLAALSTHLQQVGYHQANVQRHATPELDFS